jgi:maltooligosyltrehalose synthase
VTASRVRSRGDHHGDRRGASTKSLDAVLVFDVVRGLPLPSECANDVAPISTADHVRFAIKVAVHGAHPGKERRDTARYRYHVLANDVGGNPDRLAVQVCDRHVMHRQRFEQWPFELLATATHDTNRAEDARAGINVLSEKRRAMRTRSNDSAAEARRRITYGTSSHTGTMGASSRPHAVCASGGWRRW